MPPIMTMLLFSTVFVQMEKDAHVHSDKERPSMHQILVKQMVYIIKQYNQEDQAFSIRECSSCRTGQAKYARMVAHVFSFEPLQCLK